MIRPLTKKDLPAAAALEQSCFEIPWSLQDLEKDMDTNPFSRALVFENNGIVTGYALYWVTFEQVQLVRLAVDPGFRRQGSARKLLEALMEASRREEAEFFSLEVRASNKPAIALYESLGMSLLRRVKNYYENKEDALLMGRGI